MSSSRRHGRPIAFACVPVAFCLVGYLLLGAVLVPSWAAVSGYASFLIARDEPTFQVPLTNTYDPNAQVASASTINGADIAFPSSGERYAQLTCDRIGLNAPVYWYDSNELLAQGVGQSLMSFPPGFGRVIILAGHNTTYFSCLETIAVADVVHIQTNYGAYEYRVGTVEVMDENALESLLIEKSQQPAEELVMYTCWPFEFVGHRKTDRLVAFASKVSGPVVEWGSHNA